MHKVNLFSISIVLGMMLFFSGLFTEASAQELASNKAEISDDALDDFLNREIVIYSGRSERLIRPVLDEFTKKTGIEIILHSGGTVELLNKILSEGSRSEADVYLTVDAGTLERARIAGILQPLKSDIFEKNIPKNMRAADNSWLGLALRVRVIAYNPKKIKPEEVTSFNKLTDPKFKGILGIRTGSNVYPQAHTAMMIADRGEAETEKFLKGILANVQNNIYPSDLRTVEAVANGEIDVGIVNHYYVYKHLMTHPEHKDSLDFYVPEKTEYNVSGGAVLRNSFNQANAQQLLEFLASDEGQALFVEKTREYPVNENVPIHKDMRNRKDFTLSDISLPVMGRYMMPAIDMIDMVGYR
jgi:iron(III) transport system substrate-binding protein